MGTVVNATHREPWNKGKIVGQKAPFKIKDIWALRVRLQMERAAARPAPGTGDANGNEKRQTVKRSLNDCFLMPGSPHRMTETG